MSVHALSTTPDRATRDLLRCIWRAYGGAIEARRPVVPLQKNPSPAGLIRLYKRSARINIA